MVGNRISFIALCNNDEEIPSFTGYHCIIHQQVLCSKILKSNDIMQIAFKIVNSIRSRSLQRRQFRALLEETESEYGDLLLYTDIYARNSFKHFTELVCYDDTVLKNEIAAGLFIETPRLVESDQFPSLGRQR
ncbi:dimer_Tnp_hAT domain-containing protein [Trichonephila clavipes]|nr:dimer_Tnp_hAT domain-containing protein [Trichonephila clavipes]